MFTFTSVTLKILRSQFGRWDKTPPCNPLTNSKFAVYMTLQTLNWLKAKTPKTTTGQNNKMAIFHLNTSTISRKSGRTSTAAAAYRCGGVLYDERTDKTHDYSKKKGVVFSECFIFENDKKIILDRERVWNTAEKVEKRIDARTAREIIPNP